MANRLTSTFDKLVCNYLKIGDIRLYSELQNMVDDLKTRLESASPHEAVAILMGSGGINTTISKVALLNIEHLKLVLQETAKCFPILKAMTVSFRSSA